MHTFFNYILASRVQTNSKAEQISDFLLRPARILFNGKKILHLANGSKYLAKEQIYHPNKFIRIITIISSFVALPFALIGACTKLICLNDADYKAFCMQRIQGTELPHQKYLEIFHHVFSIADFAEYDIFRNIMIFKPLNLYECTCNGPESAFHRFQIPSRRNNLEDAIVSRLANTNGLDKRAKVILLSMGSGGLMSDFLIIEKLIIAGFRNIQLDCVDPKKNSPVSNK